MRMRILGCVEMVAGLLCIAAGGWLMASILLGGAKC